MKDKSVLVVNDKDYMNDFGSFGAEFVSSKDISLPLWKILQALSPQAKKKDPAYVVGAEEGMFFDTVNKTLVSGDVGLLCIKAHFVPNFMEWAPRESGKGLIAIYDREEGESLIKKHNLDSAYPKILPNGNSLSLSYNYFVIVINEEDGSYSQGLIPMGATSIKVGKNLNSSFITQRKRFNLPSDAGLVVRLKTVQCSNTSGSWFSHSPAIVGQLSELFPNKHKEYYESAYHLYQSVQQGSVKVNYDESQDTVSENSDLNHDDNIPF